MANVCTIFERLDAVYEYSDLGNKANPLDELVFILLSVKTPEHRYHQAYSRVRALVGDWENLLEVKESALQEAIGDAGLSFAKAKLLKGVASSLQERLGEVSLDCLFDMSSSEAEQFLRSVKFVLQFVLSALASIVVAVDLQPGERRVLSGESPLL